jgi:hypothetical protein
MVLPSMLRSDWAFLRRSSGLEQGLLPFLYSLLRSGCYLPRIMPPSLDPLVAERLRAFAQRWTRMVWVRGLCAAAVTLLAAFTALAWLDRLVVLTEGIRWLLSLGGYAATALVFWLVAGRALAKPPSTREFAALLEKAWPGLRNQVVAAVELAEKSAEGKHDSFAFRDLVQEGVARRMRDLRMDTVLPRALVAPWMRSAVTAVAAVAAMLAVPALEFPRQLARAFAPMADIERVARTKIRILEPAADTRWLAQGDHQPVVVELAGADTGRAELEVLAADGKAERVVMSPGNGGQFTATVSVGTGAFVFRVRAGDAVTKPVTIATRARPAVVAFAKTYEAPVYTQLPARQAEEEHGNVSALEGSVADVRMRVNQSVRAGELALVADGKTNLIALTAPEPNVVHARIPVRGAATYQVRLVAAETGLVNKFSPTFEIRAEPDLAPRVALESPRNDLVVAPDEVLTVRGTAGDDIGLAAVAQHFQVNNGPWVEVPLALANKTNSPVVHRWDLLLLGLATGDRVGIKLVAVDVRGARVESALALLTVGAEQSDSTRAKALAARQQVQEALESAAKAAAELRKAYTSEAATKIRAGDDVQRQQTVAGAAVALAEVERQLERADQQLAGALREADAGRESAELASLANALSAARREMLPRAQADREALAREMRETPERSNIGEAMKSSQRLADFTAQMAGNFNELVAADQADALTERLDQLAKEQQRAAQLAENAGTDPREWQRVARRETAAARETAKAEQQLAELRQRTPKSVADRLGRTQDNLKAARGNMENTLKNPAGPELGPPTRQLKSATEQAAGDARTAARELGMRADKARTELAKLTESSAEKVARLRKDLEQLAASERKLADAKKNGDEDATLKLKADADRGRAEASWRAAMEQLEDRAKAEEARRDSDPQFAAQLGQARDSLEAMRAAAEADWQNAANPERLAQMEKALRGLEAGRQLSELEGAAKALARQERFEANAPDSSTSRPRDWNWMDKQTTAAQREARAAGLGEKAASALSDAMRGDAGREVGREMAERRGGQRAARPMAEQLDQVARQMQRAQGEAAKAQAEARQSLAGTTATLSERLLALARVAAELEAELWRAVGVGGNVAAVGGQGALTGSGRSGRNFQLAGEVVPSISGVAVTNLHGRQLTLNARVGDAASAIRRDGSAQDLAGQAGRERARDAETAVELLREPPARAEAALRGALESRGAARARLLGDAARHDKDLADRLKLLAEHYRSLEAGNADASRVALRKQEDALGTRAAQDERFSQMERTQRLANLPPEELRRELAAELQRNPAMRAELERMSREAVGGARQRLQEAAEAERALARQLERAANPALEAGELWEQLRQLVEAMRRTAKDEIPAALADAEKVRVPVKDEFERGAKLVGESADKAPTQTNLPPATVAQRVAEMVPPLQRATNELGNAERRLTEAERKFSDAQKKLPEAQRDAAKATEWTGAVARGGAVTSATRRYLERARSLAEAFANVGRTSPEQALARAAQQQGEVANQLRDAAQDLNRASRNAQAMGNQQDAAALQQAAQQAQTSADMADRARRAAQDGQQSPAQAGQNAAQMGNSLDQQSAQLGGMAGPNGATPSQPGVGNAGRDAAEGGRSSGAQPGGSQSGMGAEENSNRGGGLGGGGQSQAGHGRLADSAGTPPSGAQGQQGAGASNGNAPQAGGDSAGAGTPGVRSQMPVDTRASGTRNDAQSRPGAPGEQSGAAEAMGGRASEGNQPNVGSQSGGQSRQQNSGQNNPEAAGQGGVARQQRGEGQSGGTPGTSRDGGQEARPGGSSAPGRSQGANQTGNLQRGQVDQGTQMAGMQGAGAPNSRNAPPGGRTTSGRQAQTQNWAGPSADATRFIQVHPGGGRPSNDGGMALTGGRNIQPDARWLARAVDGLNAGGPSAGADAARALEAARQAREQAMRGNAGAGQGSGQPGEGGSAGAGQAGVAAGRTGGASRAGGTGEFAALPALGELRDADWAKLPPKLAQDLRDAQQNGVSGDYRAVVEAYFKAVAERARK